MKDVMKLFRLSRIDQVPIATATPIEGWTGGEVSRTRQPLLGEGDSQFFSSSVVNLEVPDYLEKRGAARARPPGGTAMPPTSFW